MFQKIKKIAGIALLVIFALTLIAVLATRIAGGTPSFFGTYILRVTSESMEPQLKVGNIIFVKETDPAKLEWGDVITYHGERGAVANKLITHQIVSQPYQNEDDGLYYFTTRGTKEGAIDDPEIDETQIIGKVICKVPVLGTLFDFFSQWYGLVCFAAILLIAFSSEILHLLSIIRGDEDENSPDAKMTKNAPPTAYDPKFDEFLRNEAKEVITDLDAHD